MKIANIELFSPYEDYSISPKNYGGGTCFAREAKLAWLNSDMDFSIFGYTSISFIHEMIDKYFVEIIS